MQIERVDFVDIPSRDVERAIAFYRDVLELPGTRVSPRSSRRGT
jgi:catechol 2,3-dioxygenase-like lactoylglutathione lyase family enzyme